MTWAAVLAFVKGPAARYLVIGFVAFALIFGARHHWIMTGVKQEQTAEAKRLEKAKAKVGKREVKADKITEAVKTDNVKAKAQIEYRTKLLVKEVPVYVTPAADDRCIVPVGFVRLHDQAASGGQASLSQAPGGPLDAPSGIPLSDAISTVIGNYGVAYDWRAEAMAWRRWYAEQSAAWAKP